VKAPNRERVDGQQWQMAGDGEREGIPLAVKLTVAGDATRDGRMETRLGGSVLTYVKSPRIESRVCKAVFIFYGHIS